MAQTGLRHFKFSEIKDGKYTGAKRLAGAIESNMTPNVAEAELYADDTLAEKAQAFTKGTLNLTIDDDDDDVFAPLLGHYKDESTGEVFKCDDDVAPYVGFGRVVVKLVNNVVKYKAEFLLRVQFKPYSNSAKTKGENIEFQTPSVEATVFALEETVNGKKKMCWERHNTFDTEKEATDYLDNLMKAGADVISNQSQTPIATASSKEK